MRIFEERPTLASIARKYAVPYSMLWRAATGYELPQRNLDEELKQKLYRALDEVLRIKCRLERARVDELPPADETP